MNQPAVNSEQPGTLSLNQQIELRLQAAKLATEVCNGNTGVYECFVTKTDRIFKYLSTGQVIPEPGSEKMSLP